MSNSVWEGLGIKVAKVKEPTVLIGQTLFHLAHQGENDREMMMAIDRVYRAALEGERVGMRDKGGGREVRGEEWGVRRVDGVGWE